MVGEVLVMAVHVPSFGEAHVKPSQHFGLALPPLASHVADFPPSLAQSGGPSLRRRLGDPTLVVSFLVGFCGQAGHWLMSVGEQRPPDPSMQ